MAAAQPVHLARQPAVKELEVQHTPLLFFAILAALPCQSFAQSGPSGLESLNAHHAAAGLSLGANAAQAYTLTSSLHYLQPGDAVELFVEDRFGVLVDPSRVRLSSDAPFLKIEGTTVSAVRAEHDVEIGAWVQAFVLEPSGVEVPSVSWTIVRVFEQPVSLVYVSVETDRIKLRYPEEIHGLPISHSVDAHQMLLGSHLGAEIQEEIMNVTPFAGSPTILQLDIGLSDRNAVCGISGNPIRLGWNVNGNSWSNCFIWSTEHVHPGAPRWAIVFHELGHNFTVPSRTFGHGLATVKYVEGLATTIGIETMRRLTTTELEQLKGSASVSMTWELDHLETFFRDAFETWLAEGATYAEVDPDVIDGMILHYEDSFVSPDDLGLVARFFASMNPDIYDGSPAFRQLVESIETDADRNALFVAALSVAYGHDLYDDFVLDHHFPVNAQLYLQLRYRLLVETGLAQHGAVRGASFR